MSEDIVDAIRTGWKWINLKPKRIAAINAFGNVLVEDSQCRFWRICPEELLAELVAENEHALEILLDDQKFRADWEMIRPIQIAHVALGAPSAGKCYCLKLPAVLGGEYKAENFGIISIAELILGSGNIARQIKELPDGRAAQFKIID